MGGSAIAGVLGISPFVTPLDVYLSIVQGERENTAEEEEFFENRRELEPYARWRYTKKTGREIFRYNQRYTYGKFDHFKAEIDAETHCGRNVEIKTVRPEMAYLWPDELSDQEPPPYVTVQGMWGMTIHPAEVCDVFALIAWDNARCYEVPFDEPLAEEIMQKALRWWRNHVEKRRPPQPTTVEDLKRLYPRDSGRKVEASEECLIELEKHANMGAELRLLTTRRNCAEFFVKDYMKDATVLTKRGKPIATWRTQANGVRRFKIL